MNRRYPCHALATTLEVLPPVLTPSASSVVPARSKATLATWHRRLSHLHYAGVKRLLARLSVGGRMEDSKVPEGVCEGCVMGKSCHPPFPSRLSRADAPFDLIHTDICEMGVRSVGGAQYLLDLVDDASRFVWGFPLARKSDAFETFRLWSLRVQTQHNRRPRILRSDNGGEFTSCKFETFLQEQGIQHQKTVPHTSQQNGVAERLLNRTVVERAVSVMSVERLPVTLWAEVVSTVIYLHNRSPSVSVPTTPFQCLYQKPPNLSRLRAIGCVAWAHLRKDQRPHKLAPRAHLCCMLGYASDQKAYRLYDVLARKVIVRRDVTFDESRSALAQGRIAVPAAQLAPLLAHIPRLGDDGTAVVEGRDAGPAAAGDAASVSDVAGGDVDGVSDSGSVSDSSDADSVGDATDDSDDSGDNGDDGDGPGAGSAQDAPSDGVKIEDIDSASPNTSAIPPDRIPDNGIHIGNGNDGVVGSVRDDDGPEAVSSGGESVPAAVHEEPLATVRSGESRDVTRSPLPDRPLPRGWVRPWDIPPVSVPPVDPSLPRTRSGRVVQPASRFSPSYYHANAIGPLSSFAIESGPLPLLTNPAASAYEEDLLNYLGRPAQSDFHPTDIRFPLESLGPLSAFLAQHQPVDEPPSWKAAMASPDAASWRAAADDEMSSLPQAGVYEAVPWASPLGRVVTCKWVFKVKRHADGSIERYKARLVARGFSQIEGIDYEETFAPVAKFQSIRIILALAAQHSLLLHQMDVKTAFLYGELQEEVYMEMPEGYGGGGDKVWRLIKALYGLQQAPRAWFHEVCYFLRSIGFTRHHSDQSIYVRGSGEDYIVVGVYVDDLTIAAKSSVVLTQFKQQMSSRYEMKDLGELHYIFGPQVRRNVSARTLHLCQTQYIDTILARFNFSVDTCRTTKTPLQANVVLHPRLSDEPQADRGTLYA